MLPLISQTMRLFIVVDLLIIPFSYLDNAFYFSLFFFRYK